MSYGFCCKCGGEVVRRTRGMPSRDTCVNGHTFDAAMTLSKPLFDRERALADALEACIAAHKSWSYDPMNTAIEAAQNLLDDLELSTKSRKG